MLRYLETHFKIRYLVSEIAIATSRRLVTEDHWRYCALKISERNKKYHDAVANVQWILTPTKVTAHRDFLLDYIRPGKFKSWAIDLLNATEEIAVSPGIYFNPAAISNISDFFRCDSHWTGAGALKYIDPVVNSIGAKLSTLNLNSYNIKHQGNCNSGPNDVYSKEETIQYESRDFKELFKTSTHQVPDFSVTHGINANGMLGRALIIHSSSYAYMRGAFRSMFSSITEVFSPYVSAEVIKKGKFDYVLVLIAERNCAVVYDGGKFSERISAALNVPYIKSIAQELMKFEMTGEMIEADVQFMRALGQDWLGDRHEI